MAKVVNKIAATLILLEIFISLGSSASSVLAGTGNCPVDIDGNEKCAAPYLGDETAFIQSSMHVKQHGDQTSTDEENLRGELKDLKTSVLHKRAQALGISEDSLAEALDSDDSKGTLIKLITTHKDAVESNHLEQTYVGSGDSRTPGLMPQEYDQDRDSGLLEAQDGEIQVTRDDIKAAKRYAALQSSGCRGGALPVNGKCPESESTKARPPPLMLLQNYIWMAAPASRLAVGNDTLSILAQTSLLQEGTYGTDATMLNGVKAMQSRMLACPENFDHFDIADPASEIPSIHELLECQVKQAESDIITLKDDQKQLKKEAGVAKKVYKSAKTVSEADYKDEKKKADVAYEAEVEKVKENNPCGTIPMLAYHVKDFFKKVWGAIMFKGSTDKSLEEQNTGQCLEDREAALKAARKVKKNAVNAASDAHDERVKTANAPFAAVKAAYTDVRTQRQQAKATIKWTPKVEWFLGDKIQKGLAGFTTMLGGPKEIGDVVIVPATKTAKEEMEATLRTGEENQLKPEMQLKYLQLSLRAGLAPLFTTIMDKLYAVYFVKTAIWVTVGIAALTALVGSIPFVGGVLAAIVPIACLHAWWLINKVVLATFKKLGSWLADLLVKLVSGKIFSAGKAEPEPVTGSDPVTGGDDVTLLTMRGNTSSWAVNQNFVQNPGPEIEKAVLEAFESLAGKFKKQVDKNEEARPGNQDELIRQELEADVKDDIAEVESDDGDLNVFTVDAEADALGQQEFNKRIEGRWSQERKAAEQSAAAERGDSWQCPCFVCANVEFLGSSHTDFQCLFPKNKENDQKKCLLKRGYKGKGMVKGKEDRTPFEQNPTWFFYKVKFTKSDIAKKAWDKMLFNTNAAIREYLAAPKPPCR